MSSQNRFLFSQDKTPETSNFVKNSNLKISFVVACINEFSFNESNSIFSFGLGSAFILNDKFLIGAYGLGSFSDFNSSDFQKLKKYQDYRSNFSNGGIWLGYIQQHNKIINTCSTLKIGYGSVFLYDNMAVIDYNKYRNNVFIFNPSFDLAFGLTDWLRINFGIGIKFVKGFSSDKYIEEGNYIKLFKDKDFDTFSTTFSILIGDF